MNYKKNISIREYFINLLRRIDDGISRENNKYFWALKEINIDIPRGQIVAIIGKNGAGKTTLLKVISKIYRPDIGNVKTEGEVVLLTSFTSGFKPELTGIENIYDYSFLIGANKRWVDENMSKIIDIVDIGKFIHLPIKTYSSGMKSRLGFSVAYCLRPDILLLDEAMSAGDEKFRNKYGNLIEKLHSEGRTIVLATHNLDFITNNCNRAIVLDEGRIKFDGNPKEAVSFYKEL